jgi:hypothetical protein
VIHVGFDQSAAGYAPLAVHDEVVAGNFHRHAVDAQHGGGGRKPVAFLHAQLLKPAHHRGALGERRRDCQHDVFVDHRRGAFGRHLDAAQR